MGTALRSISMRIRGVNEETEETDEELKNISGDLIDLTKTAQHSHGVSVFKEGSTTEFKSLVDYLREVSQVWDEMTDKQRNDFLQKAFAKTQAQAGAAILTNFDQVDKALATMEESMGSADREMSIVEESLNYKINKLTETWTGFAQSNFSRDFFGDMIDKATTLSEWIGEIVSNLGLLKTAIIGIGTVIGSKKLGLFDTNNRDTLLGSLISGFKQRHRTNENVLEYNSILDQFTGQEDLLLTESFENYTHLSDEVRDNLINIRDTMARTGATGVDAFNAIDQKMIETATTGKTVNTAFAKIGKTILNGLLSAAVTTGITFLIDKISDLFDALIMTEEEAKQLADQFEDSFQSMRKEESDGLKQIKDVDKEYAKLSKGVNSLGQNVSLTEEEFERYHEITKLIAEKMPELIKGYTDQGEAIVGLASNVDTLTEAYQRNRKIAARNLYESSDENGNTIEGVFQNALNLVNDRDYEREFWDIVSSQGYKEAQQLDANAFQYQDALTRRKVYEEAAQIGYKEALEALGDDSYLSQILKEAGLTDETSSDDFISIHEKVLSQYEDFAADLDHAATTIADAGVNYAETLNSFYNLDDTSQTYVRSILQELGSDFDQMYNEGFFIPDKAKAKENMEAYVAGLIETINNLKNDVEAQSKIKLHFDIITQVNNGEITLEEYYKKNKELAEWISSLPDDQKKVFEIIFDLESDKQLDSRIEHLKELLGENYSEEVLRQFTANDLELLEKLPRRFSQYEDENTEFIDKMADDINAAFGTKIKKPSIQLNLQKPDDYTIDELTKYCEKEIKPEIEVQIRPSSVTEAMADMKSAVGTLGDLWEQTVENQLAMKKDKKYLGEDGTVSKQGDTNNMAVGSADPALINSVNSAFQNFITTLTDEEAQKYVAHALEEFNKTLIETPNDAEAAQNAIDDLITAYIDQGKVLQYLDDNNKQWYIDQLKAMGVTNAQQVVESRLIKTNKKLLDSEKKLADIFRKNRTALEDVNKGTDEYKDAAEELVKELKEMFTIEDVNFTPNIDVDFVKQNLDLIRQVAAGDSEAIANLQKLLAQGIAAKVHINSNVSQEIDMMRNQINELIRNSDIEDWTVDTKLNEEPLIQGLNNLVEAGKITRDSMNKILSGIGVVPYVDGYEDIDIYEETKKHGYTGNAASAYQQHLRSAYETVKAGTIRIPKFGYKVGSTIEKASYSAPKTQASSDSSGSGGGGSNNKLNEDTEETFDWIEVKIQRIEEEITRLDKVIDSTYESWSERNQSLSKELEKLTEEYKVHQHAYERYMANAKDVTIGKAPNKEDYGDDSKQYEYDLKQRAAAIKIWKTGVYQKKVREGLIGKGDIEKIENKWLVEAINSYTELYNKGVQARDAMRDDLDKYRDATRKLFDNISKMYEGTLNKIAYAGDMINEQISRTEEHEYFAIANLTKKLLDNEKTKITANKKLLSSLITSFEKDVKSGILQKGTEEYEARLQIIREKQKEIEASTTAIVKDWEEIRSKRWEGINFNFDTLIQSFNDAAEIIDARMTRTETEGYFVSAKYYEKKIALAEKEKQTQIEKLKALRNELALQVKIGVVKEGSNQWKELNKEITAAEKEIENTTNDLASLKEALEQLQWDGVNWAMDRLKALNTEAEFLIDVLDNRKTMTENGILNGRGWSIAGLHTIEYDVYMKQAEQYGKQLLLVQKKLANDPNNKKLIEKREELLNLQQESIKAAEAEKEAVKSLVSEAFNKHLSSLSKLISKYKETLSDAKDLYSYQKNIATQTEEIGNIQKQIAAYNGDTSEETRATMQQLQKQLKDAEQNLKETEWDRYISETNKMLDDMYTNYEETLNKRLDNVDELMNWMIDAVNDNGSIINSTIQSVAGEHGYKVTSQTNAIISSENIVSSFKNDFTDYSAKTLQFYDAMYDIMREITKGDKTYNKVNSEGGYSGYQKYATGSKNIPHDQLAWTQDAGSELIYRSSDGAMLTPLSRGDMVFTNQMSKNLWELAKGVNTSSVGNVPNVVSSNAVVNNDNAITVVLPNVTTYAEFREAMMKDPKITNFMQSVTIGQALGKGKLNRGNH